MVVGLDCDGVLVSFVPAFTKLIIEVTGEDKFGTAKDEADFPPLWDYPQHFGYTDEQVENVWEHIHTDPTFWLNLKELPGAAALREADRFWDASVEVYFITQRTGVNVKDQTEAWLMRHLNYDLPTVLVSGHKGPICAALGVEAYIDDRLENVRSVMRSPMTRAYLLDASWNRDPEAREGMMVVNSMQDFLIVEGLS